jgi:hypothetical protein
MGYEMCVYIIRFPHSHSIFLWVGSFTKSVSEIKVFWAVESKKSKKTKVTTEQRTLFVRYQSSFDSRFAAGGLALLVSEAST